MSLSGLAQPVTPTEDSVSPYGGAVVGSWCWRNEVSWVKLSVLIFQTSRGCCLWGAVCTDCKQSLSQLEIWWFIVVTVLLPPLVFFLLTFCTPYFIGFFLLCSFLWASTTTASSHAIFLSPIHKACKRNSVPWVVFVSVFHPSSISNLDFSLL